MVSPIASCRGQLAHELLQLRFKIEYPLHRPEHKKKLPDLSKAQRRASRPTRFRSGVARATAWMDGEAEKPCRQRVARIRNFSEGLYRHLDRPGGDPERRLCGVGRGEVDRSQTPQIPSLVSADSACPQRRIDGANSLLGPWRSRAKHAMAGPGEAPPSWGWRGYRSISFDRISLITRKTSSAMIRAPFSFGCNSSARCSSRSFEAISISGT